METTRRSPIIEGLLDEVEAESDDLIDRVVAAIRRETPALRTVPYERHRADSVVGIRSFLAGLRSGRGADEAHVQHAFDLGRDRSRDGVPLSDGIQAYHVAYREIWGHLLDRARAQGPHAVVELAQEVNVLWETSHRLSLAFSTAHTAEVARMEAGRAGLRSRLVTLLTEGGQSGLLASVATALDFDIKGDFVVIVSQPTSVGVIDVLHDRLGAGERAHAALDTQERVVLVGQGIDAGWAAQIVQETTGGRVGQGVERRGLAGAARSLVDATLALAWVTPEQPVVEFAQVWPLAILGAEADPIEPLMHGAVETAAAHPHLAEAVRAFGQSRFSVAAAARALHVHPNSAKYRLERWAALTGWDAFTPEGLIASLVAIGLAGPSGGEASSPAALKGSASHADRRPAGAGPARAAAPRPAPTSRNPPRGTPRRR